MLSCGAVGGLLPAVVQWLAFVSAARMFARNACGAPGHDPGEQAQLSLVTERDPEVALDLLRPARSLFSEVVQRHGALSIAFLATA
jgi:hypothetical protein